MASDIFEDSILRYDSIPAPGVDPYDFIVSTEAERIGKRIRTIREVRGLSQSQLGERVGLNADRIQKYENGARKPKKELLKQIARALGVQTMAIADPIIAVNMDITAMYALFELEKRTILDIDEDVCFVFSYAMHVARIKSTGTILYSNSIDNSESLTRRKRDYLCSQLHHAGLTRYKIASEASLSVPVQRVLQRSLSWLYYRAAYSSAAELLKYDLCRKERIARIKEICAVFSDYPEKSVKPVISIPVRLKMAWLIDCAARYAVQRRKF